MRNQYNDDVKLYKDDSEKLRKNLKEIHDKIDEINKKIEAQENIIKENQTKVVTIQEAIDNIKEQLLFFWIDWFTIVPSENGNEEYKLQRNWETNTEFQTLSEWEKTVISFLYFIEMCKWKQDREETLTKKIVVIDDPISSLSHMFVFNIAQSIKQKIFSDDNFEQIFILTHNLYFFHRLCFKIKNNQIKLFKISKKIYSLIEILDRNDIKNEYDSYRSILRENKNNEANKFFIANVMRNILENFFWFINRFSFNEATEFLQSEWNWKFNFFIDYINAESHTDSENIYYEKDFDLNIFYEAFEKIFREKWYWKHYDIMMWNVNNLQNNDS